MLKDVTPKLNMVPREKIILFYALYPIIPNMFVADTVKDLEDISLKDMKRTFIGKVAIIDLFNVSIAKTSDNCPEEYLNKVLKSYKEISRHTLSLKNPVHYYNEDLFRSGLNHIRYSYSNLNNIVEVSDGKDKIYARSTDEISRRLSSVDSFLVSHLSLGHHRYFGKYDFIPKFFIVDINETPCSESSSGFLGYMRSFNPQYDSKM